MSEKFWKRMWLAAVWHNVIGVVVLVFGRNWIYTSAGLPAPAPILSLHYGTWIGLVGVFGVAYYEVYRNMYKTRDLVVVGILGRITSATPQLVYFLLYRDQYPPMLIAPIFTDYIFAFLYWRFLKFLDQRSA